MIEYRFRHSRGYNFYIRLNGVTRPTTERNLRNLLLPQDETWPRPARLDWRKRVKFFVDFKLEMIKAFATEETTMFDNCHINELGVEIFARREPKPVQWRCLNPRCRGYTWKSSPRHTMGCPKCRKDKIERVEKKQVEQNPKEQHSDRSSLSQMQLALPEPQVGDGVREEVSK